MQQFGKLLFLHLFTYKVILIQAVCPFCTRYRHVEIQVLYADFDFSMREKCAIDVYYSGDGGVVVCGAIFTL